MKPILTLEKIRRVRMLRSVLLLACYLSSMTFYCIHAQGVPVACSDYAESGPIVADRDSQIIENLIIQSPEGPGITVYGFSNVIIRNVTIFHANGSGIYLMNAPNTTIEKADIYNIGAPDSGKALSTEEINISAEGSDDLVVRDVRLQKGSSGIYMLWCDDSDLSNIEGYDVRGPFPRGQLVQWDKCHRGKLTNFTSINSLEHSWPEDLVNAYESSYISIKKGYLEANNSLSGMGVMADQGSHHVTIEDIDALQHNNGCFGAYGEGVYDITMNRTRCIDDICDSVRGEPSSGSIGWAIWTNRPRGIYVRNSSYYNLCNPGNIIWDDEKTVRYSISKSTKREVREPFRVDLCSIETEAAEEEEEESTGDGNGN